MANLPQRQRRQAAQRWIDNIFSKPGTSANLLRQPKSVLPPKSASKSTTTPSGVDADILESKAGASNSFGGDAEGVKSRTAAFNSFGGDAEVLELKVVASNPPVDASARGLTITQEEDQKIKLVNIGSSFGICLSLDQKVTRIVLPKGVGISGMTACFDTADFNSGQARLLFRELGIDDWEHTPWACLFNFLGKDKGGNSLPPSVAMNLPFVGPCTIELKADGSLLSLGSFHLVGFVTAGNKREGTTQDTEVNRLSDQRSILTSNGISSRIRDKITRVVKPRNYSHSSLTWILIMVSAMLLLLGQWGNGGESGSVSPSLRPQSRPPSTTQSTRQMKDAVPASPSLPGSLRTLQGPAPLPTFTSTEFTVRYLNC
jgi:hypothetical protein